MTPEQVAALEQRHAHHRRQLEVHHRLRALELVVVQRVADDQRLARLDHLRDDRVGQLADRVGDVLAAQVARDLDHRLALLHQDQEALVGVGDCDDRRPSARRAASAARSLAISVARTRTASCRRPARPIVSAAARRRPARRRARTQLDAPMRMRSSCCSLWRFLRLLAVDEDLGVARGRREVELRPSKWMWA